MCSIRPRPRLVIRNGPQKTDNINETLSNSGHISPDLQPTTPPELPKTCQFFAPSVLRIGKYLIAPVDGNNIYKAIDSESGSESICKVFDIDKYRDSLNAYWLTDSHDHIANISEIILGETKSYVFFEKGYGDLHSYVRTQKRVKEEEAVTLFRQIVGAVRYCHDNGVILRDLKLRKFVFKDSEKKQLRLEGLEDAYVIDDDDQLTDKHGCPAYVSPEILNTTESYSGRAADIWSLGVMLYTMLVGRYPFHDTEPSALFGKIRRGAYTIPDSVPSKAKCLIKNLLRHEPGERLSADEILQHPWLSRGRRGSAFVSYFTRTNSDQTVPDYQHESFDSDFI